jgi:ABC-2 type transport system permease protein
MDKILLIIQREYLTRVKKKTFLIATLLVPILMAAVSVIPFLLYTNSDRHKTVEIIDDSGLFAQKFKNNEELTFRFEKKNIEVVKKTFEKEGINALVHIPSDILTNSKGVKIYAEKSVSLELKGNIERTIQNELRNIKLTQAGINLKILEESNKLNVDADTFVLNEEGKEQSSNSVAATSVGFFFALILYIAVLLYGSQVMAGVVEEKSNRIVEVMVSSVKPIQLMLGKIIGIGMVGITQFLLWIILTFAVSTTVMGILSSKYATKIEQIQKDKLQKADPEMQKIKQELEKQDPTVMISKMTENLPISKILICFFFYFIGGYLLYSTLYAAVGSAVESMQDAQQFSMPLTIPVIISFSLAQFVVNDPDGKIAFWASIIPFTSPINMMVRIPFGVPIWELALSMILLILGFVGSTWLAARIYRVGILMFGKKPTFKELAKWIFYKG